MRIPNQSEGVMRTAGVFAGSGNVVPQLLSLPGIIRRQSLLGFFARDGDKCREECHDEWLVCTAGCVVDYPNDESYVDLLRRDFCYDGCDAQERVCKWACRSTSIV